VTCEELNRRAIPWLRAHADEPFFLFIHYWDPHWPYTPRKFGISSTTAATDRSHEPRARELVEDAARRDGARHVASHAHGLITDPAYVSAMYDQEIRHVDEGIGEILGALDELGLSDRTLTVLFGDHGESLTSTASTSTPRALRHLLHVPFIARWPGHLPAGARVSPMFQHLDVAPTLLQAPAFRRLQPSTAQPLALLAGDHAQGGRDRLYSAESTRMAKWSLRTREHKFILARELDSYGSPPRSCTTSWPIQRRRRTSWTAGPTWPPRWRPSSRTGSPGGCASRANTRIRSAKRASAWMEAMV